MARKKHSWAVTEKRTAVALSCDHGKFKARVWRQGNGQYEWCWEVKSPSGYSLAHGSARDVEGAQELAETVLGVLMRQEAE